MHYNEIQKLFLKEGSSRLSSNNGSSSSTRYYPEKRKYANNSFLPEYRLVIIDDESDITSALKDGLELQGFKVDVFNEPPKALSDYSVGTYNLLILDVKMPKMNGFELYGRKCRTHWYWHRSSSIAKVILKIYYKIRYGHRARLIHIQEYN